VQSACPNERCPHYALKGMGNLVRNGHCGRAATRLLKCTTCGKVFSETRNTPFFRLRVPPGEMVHALFVLAESGSLRATAQATGYDKDTIAAWYRRARDHAEALRDYMTYHLQLSEGEIACLNAFLEGGLRAPLQRRRAEKRG